MINMMTNTGMYRYDHLTKDLQSSQTMIIPSINTIDGIVFVSLDICVIISIVIQGLF